MSQLTTDTISLLSPKLLEMSDLPQKLSIGIAFKTVVAPTTTTTSTTKLVSPHIYVFTKCSGTFQNFT